MNTLPLISHHLFVAAAARQRPSPRKQTSNSDNAGLLSEPALFVQLELMPLSAKPHGVVERPLKVTGPVS